MSIILRFIRYHLSALASLLHDRKARGEGRARLLSELALAFLKLSTIEQGGPSYATTQILSSPSDVIVLPPTQSRFLWLVRPPTLFNLLCPSSSAHVLPPCRTASPHQQHTIGDARGTYRCVKGDPEIKVSPRRNGCRWRWDGVFSTLANLVLSMPSRSDALSGTTSVGRGSGAGREEHRVFRWKRTVGARVGYRRKA